MRAPRSPVRAPSKIVVPPQALRAGSRHDQNGAFPAATAPSVPQARVAESEWLRTEPTGAGSARRFPISGHAGSGGSGASSARPRAGRVSAAPVRPRARFRGGWHLPRVGVMARRPGLGGALPGLGAAIPDRPRLVPCPKRFIAERVRCTGPGESKSSCDRGDRRVPAGLTFSSARPLLAAGAGADVGKHQSPLGAGAGGSRSAGFPPRWRTPPCPARLEAAERIW
jgi:hypothetical protein